MSIERIIREMPKVELNIYLEGAIRPDTLALIAEQNGIDENLKHFTQWMNLVRKPDYSRLDEILTTAVKWIHLADDLTRIAYELGVHLHRQNVRYAEVSVDPSRFTEILTFEQFMAAINDGRERARKAWGIEMAWLLCIPRNNPRSADEIARWATTANSRRNGVVGISLYGAEEVQPVGQFERAFRTAEKKGIARDAQVGDALGAEGVLEAINALGLNRLLLGWGSWNTPDVVDAILENNLSVVLSPTRSMRLKGVPYADQAGLRELYDAGVVVTVGAGMPEMYQTTLTAEYLVLAEKLGFGLEEIQTLALNAVNASHLSSEEKEALTATFREEFDRLQAEAVES